MDIQVSARDKAMAVHYTGRLNWLRAAVLGANDGILSTGSLIVGVAAASGKTEVLLAGVAGLVAGALSMAAGEYVSVSSQADAEQADIERERQELLDDPEEELDILTAIYVERGLEPALAREVAEAFTRKDALAAHVRDELHLSDETAANPLQAALASAIAFAAGAALPLGGAILTPLALIPYVVIGVSLLALALLGGIGAKAGGAPVLRAMARVVFWGAIAMAVTWVVGHLFGTSLG